MQGFAVAQGDAKNDSFAQGAVAPSPPSGWERAAATAQPFAWPVALVVVVAMLLLALDRWQRFRS